jgi:hypothetical protein
MLRTMTTLTEEAKERLLPIIDSVIALGDELQLAPEQMLCAMAAPSGSLLLCNIDPRGETEINRLIWLGQDALHLAVALRRIQEGAIGPRPDGSLGIRTDA